VITRESAAGTSPRSRDSRFLVVGSELTFVDREEHELEGAPATWRLFAVAAPE
jgi:hypothetical protein